MKSMRGALNPVEGRSIVNKTKESNNFIKRKNSSNFAYLCPECCRLYSIKASITTSMFQVPKREYDTYEAKLDTPTITIVAPDALDVTCVCGGKMIPVSLTIAAAAKNLMHWFDLNDLVINAPIATTGNSFNPGEIEFHNSLSIAPMKWLVQAILNQSLKDGDWGYQYQVWAGFVNDRTGESVRIEQFRNAEKNREHIVKMEDISYHPDTYVVIRELYNSDAAMNDFKSSISSYIDDLCHEMHKIIKKEREEDDE